MFSSTNEIVQRIRILSDEYEWHLHPYGQEQVHDDSEKGREEVSLEAFFFEVLQILEENDMY
jgi:hypothetical protein